MASARDLMSLPLAIQGTMKGIADTAHMLRETMMEEGFHVEETPIYEAIDKIVDDLIEEMRNR